MKLALLSILLVLAGLVVRAQSPANQAQMLDSVMVSTDTTAKSAIDWNQLLDYASLFLGTPYHYGGSSILGFDCSGFVSYVFNYFGFELPHSSYGMAQLGTPVKKDELKAGDLVFFNGRRSGGIGHVGLIIEAGDQVLKMIHASSSKGVSIDDINLSDYWRNRYVTARRFFLSATTPASH